MNAPASHIRTIDQHGIAATGFDRALVQQVRSLPQRIRRYFPSTALLVHMISWSVSYCGSRTLANALEMHLFVIGAALLLPTAATPFQERLSGALAGVQVYSRPTNVLLWVSSLLNGILLITYGMMNSATHLLYLLCCWYSIVMLLVLLMMFMSNRGVAIDLLLLSLLLQIPMVIIKILTAHYCSVNTLVLRLISSVRFALFLHYK